MPQRSVAADQARSPAAPTAQQLTQLAMISAKQAEIDEARHEGRLQGVEQGRERRGGLRRVVGEGVGAARHGPVADGRLAERGADICELAGGDRRQLERELRRLAWAVADRGELERVGDEEDADWLWDRSAELTGVDFF